MIVDHQTHWLSRETLDYLADRKVAPRVECVDGSYTVEVAPGVWQAAPPLLLDLDEQFRAADEHGVQIMVSSPNFLGGVFHLEGAEAADVLTRVNHDLASVQRAHPGRFVGLAMLPVHDVGRAIGMLDDAVDSGLRGVYMATSIDGRSVAGDEALPLFRRIEELGVPIVLHPAFCSNTSDQDLGMRAERGLGWMYHSALASLNIIESGTLDACPNLVILHPHLGGVLPYVRGRLDRMTGSWASGPRVLQRSVSEYLRQNFYVDTVGATPGALRLAIETYGLDRTVFATDFPFIPMAPGFDYLRASASHAEVDAILSNHVPALVPGESA